MSKKDKVSLPTKILSGHHYLNEVPVEGKTNRKFHFSLGYYDLYAAQIIRIGNCITLLSNPMSITVDSFWNTNHFEDYSRYVFWTFNKSFMLKLMEKIPFIKPSALSRCRELLAETPTPYEGVAPEWADEEYKWCYVKNGWLKRSGSYAAMYTLDAENRKALLEAIENAILDPVSNAGSFDIGEAVLTDKEAVKAAVFPDMLRPMDESPENTYQFILEKLVEADLKFQLFRPVAKVSVDKNPYGFNGCMAAMIDFFYQRDYFKKEFTLEEVFKAYLLHTGNSIGKFRTFLSEFRQDRSYLENFAKLKLLNIKNLP